MGCWAAGLGNTIPAQMERTPQIRHWCFTWFNQNAYPTWNPDKMLYLVYQVEVAPDTGNLHVQGYVEFKRSVRLGSAKKILGDNTTHFEPRQGSRDQARAYCMKEESRLHGPYEFGEWVPGEEARSESKLVVDAIQHGVPLTEIYQNFPNTALRMFKNIGQLWNVFNVKPRDGTTDVNNIVLFGDAGVGKTRFVHSYCRRHGTVPYHGYIGALSANWWEGYVGQQWALYDDFDGRNHMDVSYFKKICDRYPVIVPVKGASVEYCGIVNFFTSNVYPIEWYTREHWDAVKRRITHCIWWRSSSIVCETCRDQGYECALVAEINDVVREWTLEEINDG